MGEVLNGVVQLLDGMAFQATSGSGHAVTLDGRPEHGGADRGASPMELILLALGGCTGMTVLDMLRRRRQDVRGYEIRLEGEQADAHPKVFKRIGVEHVIRGRDLDSAVVRRTIELAATRYCPVMAMLGEVAAIDESCRLIDEANGSDVVFLVSVQDGGLGVSPKIPDPGRGGEGTGPRMSPDHDLANARDRDTERGDPGYREHQ